jgi:S1-C subfamily serine protease
VPTVAPAAACRRLLQVLSVAPNSPASRAGIRGTKINTYGWVGDKTLGDVITHFNGQRIKNDRDLFAALDLCQPSQTVEITVQQGQMAGTAAAAAAAAAAGRSGRQRVIPEPRVLRLLLTERRSNSDTPGE